MVGRAPPLVHGLIGRKGEDGQGLIEGEMGNGSGTSHVRVVTRKANATGKGFKRRV